MNVNHLHIGVADVTPSRAFYERHLGLRLRAQHGDGVFLENDGGFLLAIDPVDDVPSLPGWFHFGCCLGTEAEVLEVLECMQDDDVAIVRALIHFPGECAAFHCADPDGYRIEVSWHAE